MIPVFCFSGKKVAVFGLGLSGVTACAALKAGGAHVLAGDDDAVKSHAISKKGFQIFNPEQLDWKGIAALVLSPGIPLTTHPHRVVVYARSAGVEIIGDTELFERERCQRGAGTHVIAVTGTNGKSTSTALITHVLEEASFCVSSGGNIGVPILSLDDFSPNKIYVIEYSSYQLDLTPSLSPWVGLLLNLSPDHLDRHGDMESYVRSKAHLVHATARNGLLVVIGVDDEFSLNLADSLEVQYPNINLIRISAHKSLGKGIFVQNGILSEYLDGRIHLLADLKEATNLYGVGNWQNAAACFAVCRSIGLSAKVISSGFNSFKGLPHRMEHVGSLGRVVFINDSKSTNANASVSALLSFSPIYWIAGGRPKEGGIGSLIPFFSRIAKAFLIGEAALDFAKTLDGKVPFEISCTLEIAVAEAARAAALCPPGVNPVILFSPACASFDQFQNFESRGDRFRFLVSRLIEGNIHDPDYFKC